MCQRYWHCLAKRLRAIPVRSSYKPSDLPPNSLDRNGSEPYLTPSKPQPPDRNGPRRGQKAPRPKVLRARNPLAVRSAPPPGGRVSGSGGQGWGKRAGGVRAPARWNDDGYDENAVFSYRRVRLPVDSQEKQAAPLAAARDGVRQRRGSVRRGWRKRATTVTGVDAARVGEGGETFDAATGFNGSSPGGRGGFEDA